jgi:hypothetical protein
MLYNFLKNLCTVIGAIVLILALTAFIARQTMIYFDNIEKERQKQVCATLALDHTVQLPTYCIHKK